jgi:hypothetical protein
MATRITRHARQPSTAQLQPRPNLKRAPPPPRRPAAAPSLAYSDPSQLVLNKPSGVAIQGVHGSAQRSAWDSLLAGKFRHSLSLPTNTTNFAYPTQTCAQRTADPTSIPYTGSTKPQQAASSSPAPSKSQPDSRNNSSRVKSQGSTSPSCTGNSNKGTRARSITDSGSTMTASASPGRTTPTPTPSPRPPDGNVSRRP